MADDVVDVGEDVVIDADPVVEDGVVQGVVVVQADNPILNQLNQENCAVIGRGHDSALLIYHTGTIVSLVLIVRSIDEFANTRRYRRNQRRRDWVMRKLRVIIPNVVIYRASRSRVDSTCSVIDGDPLMGSRGTLLRLIERHNDEPDLLHNSRTYIANLEDNQPETYERVVELMGEEYIFEEDSEEELSDEEEGDSEDEITSEEEDSEEEVELEEIEEQSGAEEEEEDNDQEEDEDFDAQSWNFNSDEEVDEPPGDDDSHVDNDNDMFYDAVDNIPPRHPQEENITLNNNNSNSNNNNTPANNVGNNNNKRKGWGQKLLSFAGIIGAIGIITLLSSVLCQEGTSCSAAIKTYTPASVKKVWRGISSSSRTTASSVWDKWPLCLGDSSSDTSDANKKNNCLIILPFSLDTIKRTPSSTISFISKISFCLNDDDMVPWDKNCTSELIDVNHQPSPQCHLPGNFVDLVVLPVHLSKVKEMKKLETSLKEEVNGLKQSLNEREASEIELNHEVLDLKDQLNDAEKKLNYTNVENEQLKGTLLVAEEQLGRVEEEAEQQRQFKKRLEAEKDILEETNTSLGEDKQDLESQVSQHQAKIVLLYWVILGMSLVIIGLYCNRRKVLGGKVMPSSEILSENTEKGGGRIVEDTTNNSVGVDSSPPAEETDVSGLERDVSRGNNGSNLDAESSSTTTGDNTSTAEEDDKENHPPTVKKEFLSRVALGKWAHLRN